MANTNESFIDEVTEAVRRERINLWFRRWGWLIVVVAVLIVGAAAWSEWRESRIQAAAQFRGEAILSAVEIPEPDQRVAALADLPREGGEGVVASLLLASEQGAAGNAEAAAETLGAVAADGDVSPLYRDLASLKRQMALGPEADRDALQALAAPGAPFRLLALEQIALLDLDQGDRDAAVATLREVREDAGVTTNQLGRIDALLTALGAPAEASAPNGD